jgi:hypothetical protein
MARTFLAQAEYVRPTAGAASPVALFDHQVEPGVDQHVPVREHHAEVVTHLAEQAVEAALAEDVLRGGLVRGHLRPLRGERLIDFEVKLNPVGGCAPAEALVGVGG